MGRQDEERESEGEAQKQAYASTNTERQTKRERWKENTEIKELGANTNTYHLIEHKEKHLEYVWCMMT